jgi:hypothetical protein
MGKNEYPKLLAIGWNPMGDDPDGTLIYLLEDEIMFYGYAQNPNFHPRVKPGYVDVLALRWCQGLVLPKGNEDVNKLYLEAIEILKNDEKYHHYLKQKRKDKIYDIDIKESVKKTLSIPSISKYFI